MRNFGTLFVILLSLGCDPRYIDPRWNHLAEQHVATIPGEFHHAFFNRPVTDEQFTAAVPGLRSVGVRELGVSRTRITDASIDQMLTLKNLERLDVDQTRLSAEGLTRLHSLPKLRTLVVARGQYSPDDLQKLRAALPEVDVIETLPIGQMPE